MKLVILDRDGVINHDSAEYIKTPAEWRPIERSIEAISMLSRARYTVVVATNQSGIARKLFDLPMLTAIHDNMCEQVAKAGGQIDKVFFCPHHPDDHCHCRKPKTGLLEQISQYYQLSLVGVPFVGDADRDLIAGKAMGCSLVLVRTGSGRATEARGALSPNTLIFDDLWTFAQYWVSPRGE